MAIKKFTVIFVPEKAHKVRQFKIPAFFALFSVLLLISSLGAGIWIARDYISIKAKLPELQRLQRENAYQKKQFLHLARRIEGINRKLYELKEFDRRLKVMVNLETAEDPADKTGIGGSDQTLVALAKTKSQDQRALVRAMHEAIDDLNTEIALGKKEKADLDRFLENQKMLLASTPSIWPTRGWLSSGFGYRISPFTGQREFHKGIDISTRMKAPIVAPANGIVTRIAWDHGYGRILTVTHGHGIVTRYAHLSKVLVKKGQYVKRGETIALVGNTGRSTGPHLHYEVLLNGMPVNPLRYILN